MPNPYHSSTNLHHPKHWDPNWVDYSKDQINDERRLFNYLMRNYDTNIRPTLNSSHPINIRLGVTLAQIFDLDEKNQVLTTNIWLDQEWIDEFLTWNASDYGNITKIRVPCQSIWLPDIVLYNNADDYTRGYMCSRAVIEPNGNVFWPPPTKLRSTCDVDVTYFPFDDQACKMKLGSWIYDGNQVNILNRTENVDLSNYVANGEWDLISTSLVRNVVYYPCCVEPFPDVTITLVIRRKILYYMYNVILPCIMMSVLTLLVFCLPPESGEKIALGVTVLLAFSVFMLAISEKLPETSESIPLLGMYLTVVMGITSISIVMTVVVLNFHYCSPLNKRELPDWLKRLVVKHGRNSRSNSTIFEDYREYYDKYCLDCHGPPVECTNCHKGAWSNHNSSVSPTTNTTTVNTNSTNESNTATSSGNWFDSAPPPLEQQQQQPLFNISNSIGQTNKSASINTATAINATNPKRVWKGGKSKWKGQVDRFTASLLSANKLNKVHSSEPNYVTSNEVDKRPSRNQPGSSSYLHHHHHQHHPHPDKQSAIGACANHNNLPNELINNANVTLSRPSNTSSAFQEYRRPKTVASTIPASYDNPSIGNYNRELLQRSTMLNNISPYFLGAAARLIGSNRMGTMEESINEDHHLRHRPGSCNQPRTHYSSTFNVHHAQHKHVNEPGDDPFYDSCGNRLYRYQQYNTSLDISNQSTNMHEYHQIYDQSTLSAQPKPAITEQKQNGTEHEILHMLRYLMHRQEIEDNCTRRIHEWRQLSMFLDKILFWVFLVITVFTSVLFLVIIPIQRRGL